MCPVINKLVLNEIIIADVLESSCARYQLMNSANDVSFEVGGSETAAVSAKCVNDEEDSCRETLSKLPKYH